MPLLFKCLNTKSYSMKIAFVNPPYKQAFSRSSRWPEITKSGTMYYPIWLAYATGAAEKAGHEVFLIDAIAKRFDHDQTIQELEKFKPDMVVVDSSTPSIKNDVEFIENYKNERPELKTVLVGTHVSALPYETMQMSASIDFIAKHEYDYTIIELAEALGGERKINSVTGLVYRDKGKIVANRAREPIKDLDEIPFVSEIYKRFLNINDYRYALATHPMVQVMSCYDDKTEILTENGWKFFKDLRKIDKVATLDSKTKELKYYNPRKIMKYNHDGAMYRVKSKQVDLLITPNHKVYFSKFGRNYKNKFKLDEVQNISHLNNLEFKKNAIWKGKEGKYFILPGVKHRYNIINGKREDLPLKISMDTWLEFLGYYLSEGSCNKKKNNIYRIKIDQSKLKNRKKYNKIRKCIKEIGYNFYENKDYFEISNKQLYTYLKRFGKCYQKYVPEEIKQLSSKQLKIFLDAFILGDGHIAKSGEIFITSSSTKMIDDIQEILLKMGISGNVSLQSKKGTSIKGGKYKTNHDIYRIIPNQFTTPRLNYGDRKHITKTKYKGKVYCCEVKNHIVYVRRNGKPCWSGNSRGCPNLCSFCVYPQTMMGRKFRPRSAENFVKELVWISKNIRPKEIFVEDDTFAVDKERVMKICNLIKEYELNIKWSCNVRADVPLDVLKKMKEAGCRMVIVGYESGNQKILNNIKKGITINMAEEFTENAKEAGLKIFGCFMIGLPGETLETIEETFKHAERLRPDMVFFQQAVPFPGTEFYQWVKLNKYLTVTDWDQWLDKNGQLDCIVSYPNLSNKEICRLKDKLMVRYYTSRKQIVQTFTKNTSPDEMKRTVKAGFDYVKYLVKRKVK